MHLKTIGLIILLAQHINKLNLMVKVKTQADGIDKIL